MELWASPHSARESLSDRRDGLRQRPSHASVVPVPMEGAVAFPPSAANRFLERAQQRPPLWQRSRQALGRAQARYEAVWASLGASAPLRAHNVAIGVLALLCGSAIATVVIVERLRLDLAEEHAGSVVLTVGPQYADIFATLMAELCGTALYLADMSSAGGVTALLTAATALTPSVDAAGVFLHSGGSVSVDSAGAVAVNGSDASGTALATLEAHRNSTCVWQEGGGVSWQVVNGSDARLHVQACVPLPGDAGWAAVSVAADRLGDEFRQQPRYWYDSSHVVVLDDAGELVYSSRNEGEPVEPGAISLSSDWFLRGVGQALDGSETTGGGDDMVTVELDREYRLLSSNVTVAGWDGDVVLVVDWDGLTHEASDGFDRAMRSLSGLMALGFAVSSALLFRLRSLMGPQGSELQDLDRTIDDYARDIEQTKVASAWKTEIIARMYFAVRLPLSNTLGLADHLLQRPAVIRTERVNAAVLELKADVAGTLNLLDNAYDMARMDLDQFEPRQQPFALQALVEECVLSFLPLCAAKEVDLVLDCLLDNDMIVGDGQRILQLLTSLLCNAVRHVDAGFISVVVDVTNNRSTGPCLLLIVEDTGCGLHTTQLTALQARLSQPSRDLRNETQIGLAMVRHIVSRLGGHMTLTSVLGHGTTVSLRLPIPPRSQALSARPPLPWADLFGVRVLLAYEGDHARGVLAGKLRKRGLVVDEAGAWQAAELRLNSCEQPYGVVIISRAMVAGLLERGADGLGEERIGFSRRSQCFDNAITPLSVLCWVFRFDQAPPSPDWVRRTGFDIGVRTIMPSFVTDTLDLWLHKNAERRRGLPDRTRSEQPPAVQLVGGRLGHMGGHGHGHVQSPAAGMFRSAPIPDLVNMGIALPEAAGEERGAVRRRSRG